ncbi:CoA-transferase [Bauldia sp.]|uniref:CoA-transferase n=1 Tax=Bauldia sp. TaxID=2575872 RepID=UPI003BA88EC2
MAAAPVHESLVKPNRPIFTDVAGLAAMVDDGDMFGIGGHHFARLPIAQLLALADRGVRDLHYTSWAGGLSLEVLLDADAVASIDICFSSLDIFGLAPRFRAAAESGSMPVRDWTALAMIQALKAAEQNLPALPFAVPAGSDMMDRIPCAVVEHETRTSEAVGTIPPLRLDTVLLHAPRADEHGNVQTIGALALDWAMVSAARKVLVTVEEIVPPGTLAKDGRQTVLTRNRVSAIAQAEGGAWPCSCLPFYVTDYAALRDFVEADAPLAQSRRLPPGGVPDHLRTAARIPASVAASGLPVTPSATPDAPPTVDEMMAWRLAAELDNDSFASAGAVSPLANVAYRLAKATHAPDMIIATMTCGHVDIDPSPMTLSLIEPFDAETAVTHAGGDDTYATYYQAGAVTHEIVGAGQVDRRGQVNTIAIRKKDGGTIRLPGQGGMADVANMDANFIVYVTRHNPLSLVETVDVVSSARGYVGDAERQARGLRPGAVKLFTNLCVFELDLETRELAVVEIMPEVTREAIADATGFVVRFSKDCREVGAIPADDLRVLREQIDPLGLRRLEFVGARDRGALLDEIISRDRDLITALAVQTEREDATA